MVKSRTLKTNKKITIILSDSEHKVIEKNAHDLGLSISGFLRMRGIENHTKRDDEIKIKFIADSRNPVDNVD